MIKIIDYSAKEEKTYIDEILGRSQLAQPQVQEVVDKIISEVAQRGDEAVLEYIQRFDDVTLTTGELRLTQEEVEEAYKQIDQSLIPILKKSAVRIEAFHQKQKQNSWLDPSRNGETMGQLIRPLESVGIYVPGGTAAYPSSVLMNAVPAKVAGVERIVMTTPCRKNTPINPATVVAAHIAGVTEIYKVGGAQAIAALAFGTDTIPKVDKIVGPGNIYVALAKKSVYGYVNIDSVAGPSEILIIADDSANPVYVAADLLSQAEHDMLASSVLITNSKKLAQEVHQEIAVQTKKLSRAKIIEASLRDYGAIIVTEDLDTAIGLSNKIAPEHLEVCTKEAFSLLPKIKNAGAIFLGHYSPEPLGDYMAGPNHVLPTGGTARFFSPLNIDDFVKKSSVISFSREALLALKEDIICFANSEGLTAHANALKVRE